MRREKRKWLETKGWRFGTVQVFLGLSTEDAASVEDRQRLAAGIEQCDDAERPRHRGGPRQSTE
jgi:hypothetical protein